MSETSYIAEYHSILESTTVGLSTKNLYIVGGGRWGLEGLEPPKTLRRQGPSKNESVHMLKIL